MIPCAVSLQTLWIVAFHVPIGTFDLFSETAHPKLLLKESVHTGNP